MMKIYGTQSLILVVLFFLFLFLFWVVFLQSKPSADNDKHEGEIKIYIQTKKWDFQDKKQKHRSKTGQHKAESQGKAQISIKSLKWDYKQQIIANKMYLVKYTHAQLPIKMKKKEVQLLLCSCIKLATFFTSNMKEQDRHENKLS
uniref:Uncharacterized protein n=2 Tax=Micrurus TaxID=8634 RepID=A0A2D4IPQ7_MICLE